ncbi:MAG TPA: MBL fold metallo-hydrolase [Candidatus Omnitrophota bacterium]|nr:MBL fold metallo-hydrolase [Candidatus Omnitrophota bacterium]
MRDIQPSLSFLGGAGTVTGSKYLIQAYGSQILLDAGLFQGLKELRLRNWAKTAFDPKQLNAVVLSHAHIDHSGYLPVLHKHHFKGKVFCTHGTADLLKIMLPDSAFLQEEEAARANRKGYSKHHPALALCTLADAEGVLKQVKHYPYEKLFEVRPGIHALYRRAGHILGSATVELQIRRKGTEPLKLVFSGDLGRWHQPILRDPEPVLEADILLLESTYGNRIHPTDAEERLAQIIRESAQRGGALIIPAFAIGRTQQLVWTIRKLEQEGKIPVLPVYMDSPMAISASEIYHRHPEDHDLDMQKLMNENETPLNSKNFRLAKTPEESQALNSIKGPVIIISASGMATGGRILHHLKNRLPDPKNTVLLPGYQAAGTRGRSLQDGAKTVRMQGQDIPVNAKVELLDGLSAHADQNEILKWLSYFKKPPKVTYLVHGEEESLIALRSAIREKLNWNVEIAQDGFTVPLT